MDFNEFPDMEKTRYDLVHIAERCMIMEFNIVKYGKRVNKFAIRDLQNAKMYSTYLGLHRKIYIFRYNRWVEKCFYRSKYVDKLLIKLGFSA